MNKVLFDSNIWIAYIDKRDVFHKEAVNLVSRFIKDEIIIFDVIINEVLSVFARRLQERGLEKDFKIFVKAYIETISEFEIIWIYENVREFFDKIIHTMNDTEGRLGFNDALIVYGMIKNNISQIVTFDNDFKLITSIEVINKL